MPAIAIYSDRHTNLKGGRMNRNIVEAFGVNALNTVEETKRILRRCTTAIYEDMAIGRLVGKKIGGSTRVTGESIIAYIEQAPPAVITTGLVARGDDMTAEQRQKLASTTPLGITMRTKRHARPIGSKSKSKIKVSNPAV
jgi:hypothetical protein